MLTFTDLIFGMKFTQHERMLHKCVNELLEMPKMSHLFDNTLVYCNYCTLTTLAVLGTILRHYGSRFFSAL